MKLEIFSADHFRRPGQINLTSEMRDMACIANHIFNEWLATQPVVYGFGGKVDPWYSQSNYSGYLHTHSARLIDIQELRRECEHPWKSLSIHFGFPHEGWNFTCNECKKLIKPKGGWEVVR